MRKQWFAVAFILMGILHPAISLGQSQNSQAPAKIALVPLHSENRLGEEIPLQVKLLDRNGQPASAGQNVAADVKVEQPSGQVSNYTVNFAPGESSKQLPVSIPESGVSKVTVEQSNKELIGGSNFVLVRPANNANKRTGNVPQNAKQPKTQNKSPNSELRRLPGWGTNVHLFQAALRVSAPSLTTGSFPALTVPVPVPQLQLAVSGEDANGGTRADGKTCALVQVFYLGESDLQRDVQIWMTFSNGRIDSNPIVIRKGSAVG